MRKDEIENKVKKIFGSMSNRDLTESLSRKEDIWQSINADKGKKKSKQWLLLLLLASLFFAGGWILRDNISQTKSPQMNQEDKNQPNQVNQFALTKMKTQLRFKESQIDSLFEINKTLSIELKSLNNKSEATNTIYVRDTSYITEVKIEQQVVTKYIRDTILIETPLVEKLQAGIAEAKVEDFKEVKSNDQTTDIKNTPSSIQFNFSEPNLKDK